MLPARPDRNLRLFLAVCLVGSALTLMMPLDAMASGTRGADGAKINNGIREHNMPEIASSVLPAAPEWRIAPKETKVIFHAKQMGTPVTGKIPIGDNHIIFDPDNMAGNSVTLTIPAKDVTAGTAKKDNTLHGADWLDVENHPKITFQSHQIKHIKGQEYQVQGELTIRQITARLAFPFTLKIVPDGNQNKAIMQADFTLNRLNWKLGRNDWADTSIVPAEVKIEIRLIAYQNREKHT